MIQRIQSIYLFLASIASFAVFKLPFASSVQSETSSSLFNDGIYSVFDNMALLAIFALIGLLAITTLFFYKNRKLQSNLSLLGSLLSLIAFSLMAIFFAGDSWALSNWQTLQDQFGLGMPVFAAVFYLLARYNIQKDNKKVQSMDRLR
ncbi:MAG: DUF4293 domain-containing protein [Saprospiraceae bacterium]